MTARLTGSAHSLHQAQNKAQYRSISRITTNTPKRGQSSTQLHSVRGKLKKQTPAQQCPLQRICTHSHLVLPQCPRKQALCAPSPYTRQCNRLSAPLDQAIVMGHAAHKQISRRKPSTLAHTASLHKQRLPQRRQSQTLPSTSTVNQISPGAQAVICPSHLAAPTSLKNRARIYSWKLSGAL